MSTWTKSRTTTVDQRSEALPPTWCPRPAGAAPAGRTPKSGVLPSSTDRALARRICEAIDGARDKVVVSSFLFADAGIEASLLRAAGRGVRVYVLLASETRLEREPREDSEFDQRLFKEHKAMLDRLAGWALLRSAPEFHAKAVLVDPDAPGPGFLLTANLTKEALERNEELGVDLTPDECRAVCEILRWAMWERAEHEVLAPERLSGAKPLGRIEVPAPSAAVFATLASSTALAAQVMRVINGARHELWVSSFGWGADHAVVRRLCERARAGLKITVLARVRPAAMPALIALRESGATVLGFEWLHAKALWTDAGEALVMSANLEAQGLDRGFELGVVLHDGRVAGVDRALRTWAAAARWELDTTPTLGRVEGAAKVWQGKGFVDYPVAQRKEVDLGTLRATSADQMDLPAPAIPKSGGLPQPAHEVVCRWTVEAPRLAPKSKPRAPKRKSADDATSGEEPPMFEEPGGRLVVVVRRPEEVGRASARLAARGAAAVVVHEGA